MLEQEHLNINCLNFDFPKGEINFDFEKTEDIFLFAVKLEQFNTDIIYLSSLCSPKELARSRRYLSENDSKRFVITRGLLRVLLSKFLNKDPKEIEIEIGENKKPKLKDNNFNINFNVSHTNACAIIAVSKSLLGVDVENAQNLIDYSPIMDACFSINEKIFVDVQADSLKAFYTIWTRKESLLKLFGKGIDDDIKSIEVLDGLNSIDTNISGALKGDFKIISFDLPDGKIAALALLDDVELDRVKFYNLQAEIFTNKQFNLSNV